MSEPVACPFCAATATERIALFGSQLLVSQYRCKVCGSYFEALRDDRTDEMEAEMTWRK
jgi:transposase-like protein